jgi:hypothetical protein
MPKKLELEGLRALTDETGMFQHSKYSTVDRKEGYTTDDNARALIAALRHHQVYGERESLELANTYLTFLFHMQRSDGRFHNLLGYDRRYKDDVGSEDCMGRALWACGYTLVSDIPEGIRNLAKEILDRGLPPSYIFTSPRAKAFAILGLRRYNEAFPDDPNIIHNLETLADGLIDQYRAEAEGDWRWFEPYLTYSNARLTQALFAAYESAKERHYLKVAKASLDFLIEVQMISGRFVPIGTNGWFLKNGKRALYDQQPIEASCLVEAMIAAWKSTGGEVYRDAARTAFDWFHGGNLQGVLLYSPETGTCYDGITPDGLNKNQGAESTLSYYLAYLEMRENNLI